MSFDVKKIKENKYKLNRGILGKKAIGLPSRERRHVKDQSKVDSAIKDLYENHNHSWYSEILLRNKDNKDKPALFYRGKVITYGQMFEEADKIANALANYGLVKDDEVLMCVSNTPEMVYLLLACSKLGLRPNVFGSDFDKDYIKEIIVSSTDKIMFISDDNYPKISDVVDNANVKRKVFYSVLDSFDDKFVDGVSNDSYLRRQRDKYRNVRYPEYGIHLNDFIEKNNIGTSEVAAITLDDTFTITYTSGSTKNGRPKATVHRVRSFNAMGRFHDHDLSGTPEMNTLRSLAHIPPHSNTCLITSISDMLFQGGTVVLESIYSKETFLDSLIHNEPSMAAGTRSHYVHAAKEILYNPKYKNLELPYLYAAIIVGEPCSRAEAKLINRALHKVHAGTKVIPWPLSPVTHCEGGGQVELGGLFFTAFKGLRQSLSFSKEEYGLKPFQHVNVKVLDENLQECGFGELGKLVADSICTMQGYKNNEEATNDFFITDADGETYGQCNVWGYIDKKGNAHMKDRVGNEFKTSDGKVIHLFKVADKIFKQGRAILSCEIVNIDNQLVAFVEFHPEIELSEIEEHAYLSRILSKISKEFGYELANSLYFSVVDSKESYPLTGCGKRNVSKLEQLARNALASKQGLKKGYIVKKLFVDENDSKTSHSFNECETRNIFELDQLVKKAINSQEDLVREALDIREKDKKMIKKLS